MEHKERSPGLPERGRIYVYNDLNRQEYLSGVWPGQFVAEMVGEAVEQRLAIHFPAELESEVWEKLSPGRPVHIAYNPVEDPADWLESEPKYLFIIRNRWELKADQEEGDGIVARSLDLWGLWDLTGGCDGK